MTTSAMIAFQGGGALGIAHLGAWQILSERFTITHAAGTSAGSIVAAHCSAGYDPAHVIEIFQDLDWQRMVARQGVLGMLWRMDAWSDGEAFYQWLLTRMATRFPDLAPQQVTFKHLAERTRIGLTVVACDLNAPRPEPVIFSAATEAGTTVAFAVRASISIPGYFAPVPRRDKGQELVDGGVLLNLPARLLQPEASRAGQPLIGVRFVQPLEYLDQPRIWETIGRTKNILLAPGSLPFEELLSDPSYLDVTIDTSGFNSLNFSLTPEQKLELVRRGRDAAERALLVYDKRQAERRAAEAAAKAESAVQPPAQPGPASPQPPQTQPGAGGVVINNTPPAPEQPWPAAPKPTPTATALKRAALERRLAALQEEYEAVNTQINGMIDDAMRLRIERKAEQILEEIARNERDLQGLR